MAVEFQQASPGGLFSNKRNLLIMAGVVGGGIGLVFLLSRKTQDPKENEANDDALDATGVQVANVANQLLGFRGDSSVYFANFGSGLTNLASQLTGVGGTLGTQIAGVSGQVTGVGTQVAGVSGQIGTLSQQEQERYGNITGLLNNIRTLNTQQYSSLYGMLGNLGTGLGSLRDDYNDFLTRFMQETQSRQASDASIMQAFSWLNFSRTHEGRKRDLDFLISQTDDPVAKANYYQQENRLDQFMRAAGEVQGLLGAGTYQSVHGAALPTAAQLNTTYDTFVTQGTTDIYGNPRGAGGASFRDVLWNTFDNSQGNYAEMTAAVSSGPVRYLHRAR